LHQSAIFLPPRAPIADTPLFHFKVARRELLGSVGKLKLSAAGYFGGFHRDALHSPAAQQRVCIQLITASSGRKLPQP